MENNKEQFIACGIYINSPHEKIELQISNCGNAARYLGTIVQTTRPCIITRGRWQKIRYNLKNGEPYITKGHKRLYLRDFIRVNAF